MKLNFERYRGNKVFDHFKNIYLVLFNSFGLFKFFVKQLAVKISKKKKYMVGYIENEWYA